MTSDDRFSGLSPEKRALLEERLKGRGRRREADTIPARGPDAHPCLSFAQQRMWFLDQLEPGSAEYNMSHALRVRGTLDVEALARALSDVVTRHESLRTTFAAVEGEPYQVIHPPAAVPIDVIDLDHLDNDKRELEAQRIAAAEAQRPFDLEHGPLLRTRVLRLDRDDHVVVLVMHHIVSDGWSTSVFTQELSALYEAHRTGERVRLPELPIQYADFAAWQRRWLEGDVLERQLGYWRERLRGLAPVLELPADHPRPAVRTGRGGTVPLAVDAGTIAALSAVARAREATLFMTLAAAFQTLLSRYSGADDIAIGTPIAGRTRGEIEPLIGLFVNTLVLRTDLSGNPTFGEVVDRVRDVALDAYAHQDVPFEKLVEELHPERSLSHTPLFQVMFALTQASSDDELTLGDAELEGFALPTTTARLDLTLNMVEDGTGATAVLEYNSDLFERSTIERLAGHLVNLLRAVAADPDRPLSELDVMNATERDHVLELNDTTAHCPADRCIHELFEAQVSKRPEAIALLTDDDVLTYRELNAAANRLAHHLAAKGVGPDVPVGICLERGPDLVVGLLAISKAGGAYVPLDPDYPPDRLAFMLEDTAAPVVVTTSDLAGRIDSEGAELVLLDADRVVISENSETSPVSVSSTEDLAYVIYTSGSTGNPKGVGVTHANVVRLLNATAAGFRFDESDVWTMFHSFAFDFSVWELWGALLSGGRVVVVPKLVARSPDAFVQLVRDRGVTVLNQTPSAFRQFVRAEAETAGGLDLRVVVFGGEGLDPATLRPWVELHGVTRPRLVNMYGITETTVHVTRHELTLRDIDSSASPIGRPIPDLRVYILDPYGNPVPLGVPGELYVGGAGLARGYVNRPALTAERFVPDPFSGVAGARLYRTGDRARCLTGGDVEFLGRVDDQVKIRGFRIEPGEIEARLVAHEAIDDAAVVARADDGDDKRLVAYVVGDHVPTTTELRAHVIETLPDHMVPAHFVVLDELPLTPNGKLDRAALPAPEGRPELEASFVAPRTPAEETLAGIWCEVLGLEQVGIHDNFFELGGDSILSIQIVARANAAGLGLTPRLLFQHQTVAGLAAVAGTRAEVVAEQGPVVGEVPLTPIQRWFFELDLPQRHHFNQSMLLAADGTSPELVREALVALVDHHDALRLRFVRTDDGWTAYDEPAEDAGFFSVPEGAFEATCAALQASLDLEDGPLLRAAWFDHGGGHARLFLCIHHLAVDGVSWRILLEDLDSAYAQLSRGDTIAFPPKTTSFKEWAERLAAYASSDEAVAELDYWSSQGGSFELPVDFDVGPNDVASAESITVSLTEAETDALLNVVPAAYRTQINDVLVAAVARAIASWTGSEHIAIDLEGHGREDVFDDVDLTRTVGWFTSLFPVALRVERDPAELLKAIKEQLRALPHRGLGYGVLRYLAPGHVRDRLVSQAPLSFNYLGRFGHDAATKLFSPVPGARGSDHALEGERGHLVEVDGAVSAGRLHMTWTYSRNLCARATIERVAEEYLATLRELIAHCRQKGAGGVTPSDFPLAGLDQKQLDRLWDAGSIDHSTEDLHPLTPMQQGMLFHTLYEPGSALYFEQLTMVLEGDLDGAALARAWEQTSARHAPLRSAVSWEGLEQPLQVVRRGIDVPFETRDLRALPEGERDAAVAELLAADRARGFDLTRAPLQRVIVVRLDDRRNLVVWSHHHLLLDGWSVAMVRAEVLSRYHALARGDDLDVPPAPSYRDYIAWLEQRDAAGDESYWRERLAGFVATTPILDDGDTGAAGADRYTFELDTESSAALGALTRRRRITLNTVIQAVWALLLSRYSGEDDVVFGATVSGRPAELPGIQEMVGLFINTVPVRISVGGSRSVREWLDGIHADAIAQRDYEHSALTDIHSWSEVPGATSLFDTIVVFENHPIPEAPDEDASELTITDAGGYERTNYPLGLVAAPGDTVLLAIDYDRSRFETSTITRMATHVVKLLQAVASDPDLPPYELDLLTEAERRHLVAGLDDAAEYPTDRCVHELFATRVQENPGAVAVTCGDVELGYGELDAAANRLAHHLVDLGVGAGVPVAVCLERGPDVVVSLLATLKAGGVYVPLDPDYPAERLAFMVRDSGAGLVVTDSRSVGRLPRSDAQIVVLDEADGAIAARPDTKPGTVVSPDDVAYVIYTSGSTGTPKGVMVSHGSLAGHCLTVADHYALTSADRMLVFTSFSFDASLEHTLTPLTTGASVVLRDAGVWDPDTLADKVSLFGITVLDLPTAYWHQVAARPEVVERLCASSVRIAAAGGEAMAASRARQWMEGSNGRLPLLNTYGPTETTITSTSYEVTETGRLTSGTVPIGRPLGNTSVYVLDAYGNPVPTGVPGELYIGGAGVARGYVNRPGPTAERFVPDPFSGVPGARLYRTGDRARYLHDGNVEFLGRVDHQVKIRGFRIEPGEIEACLVAHEAVRDAVVVARADGGHDKRLVAYFTAVDSSNPPGPPELRAHVSRSLPEYMVPAAFVSLDELPLTPNGKVDRAALPAPDGRPELDAAYAPPRTPAEEILAEIWCEVLAVDRAGIHDDFFELGGHSLVATQVVSRVRAAFGVELPLRALFESPTVAQLAVLVGEGDRRDTPAIEPVPRDAELPLSFAQQRLWFLDQLEPGSAEYNVPYTLRARGRLDVDALGRALTDVVARHETLRTTFATIEGRPVQVIHPPRDVALEVTDVDREDDAKRIAEAEATRTFDLERGPLLRARVLRLGPQDHVVLLNMHHIVSDGWSTGVLSRELSALYEGHCDGEPVELPELPIQYADFAAWQRRWLTGEVLERKLDYWRARLAGLPPVLELPTDRPRPPVRSGRGATVPVELEAGTLAALRAIGRAHNATLFMTLAAGFQALLSRYAGSDDVAIGTPVAGRTQAEIEDLIGFFVNTFVLRTDLSGDPSFGELVERVRAAALGAYAHQDVPFEKLVEELQPQRSLSHTPLFQVMLALQHAGSGDVPKLGDADLDGFGIDATAAKFDLTLNLVEDETGAAGIVEYDADLFEPTTVERMAGHLQNLLNAVASDPDRALSELDLMSAPERHHVVVELNDTAAGFAAGRCVHELFEARALETPDALALESDAAELTYREVNRRANRLAHHLVDKGVRPEVPVGICLERGPDLVVALLAVSKAGGAYVPLDPGYPAERLSFMLEDTAAPVVVTTSTLAGRLGVGDAEVVLLDADETEISSRLDTNPARAAAPEDLAYVVYTSGSTGTPKGVAVTHRSLVNLVAWHTSAYGVTSGDRATHVAPLGFDASVWELWPYLASGAALVFAPEHVRTSPSDLVAWLVGHGITVTFLPTALVHEVFSGGHHRALTARTILTGGDQLRARPDASTSFDLVNHYGPTEATVVASAGRVAAHGVAPPSIGRPIANTAIYVLDAHGNPLPIGVPGELYVGGAGVARGYVNRPGLTAERFVPDPFSGAPGARLYRTGDRARWLHDGSIEFLGRVDHQVKIRGFRIEPGEIEACLVAHETIRDAVVVARSDGGDKRLVAYVVGEDVPTTTDLRAHVSRALPDHMVPAHFVVLDELPLTPNGKLDRAALPAPEGRPDLEAAFTPARTPAEETLAGIWCEVLGLEQVGIHDNFFELGGDSILSIQIVARANAAGLGLTPRLLFQHQTVAGLAAVAGTRAEIAAEQGPVVGEVPLTPIQRWFFELDLPQRHHFNQSMLLAADGTSPELVREALVALVDHHDALRLRFVRTDDGWTAYDEPAEDAGFFSVPEGALEATCAALQASLDLEDGPLLRAAWFDHGGGHARLFLCIHHLAVDGVSWRILLEDLDSAYAQLSRGDTIAFPPKTTSFKQWAERLAAYASSDDALAELDYWSDRGDPFELPVDFDVGPNDVSSEDSVTVSLTEADTSALLNDVPPVYRTQVNDVLVAAVGRAISSWTGSESVAIDLEGHGREDVFEDVDLTRTVGWFTSLFPVSLRVDGRDPAALLKGTKEQLRALPSRGLGYGVLRYLAPEDVRTRLARPAPLSFNYLGRFGPEATTDLFSPVPAATGPEQAQTGERAHLVEVNGSVSSGRLHMSWTFSRNRHERATIERAADEFVTALRALVTHCRQEGAGGVTPSDFPLAGLDQAQLDELWDERLIDRSTEDLYPLTPLQQGMLFHTLYDPGSAVYFQQLSLELSGPLDVAALRRAWHELGSRHEVLRTAVVWQGLPQPLSVVGREVEPPLSTLDWTGLDAKRQEESLREFLAADRARGFDLTEAPLMRSSVITTGLDSRLLVWSFHHLLLDGWSMPLVLGELFSRYHALAKGGSLEAGAAPSYRAYVQWLQERDPDADEHYWREQLAGFDAPTPIPHDRDTGEKGASSETVTLDPEITAALESLARGRRATLNTVIQGAWALLLSRYGGEDDVVFGATVSGRPADLPGVGETVGLFINTVPVRVAVDGSLGAGEWLERIQQDAIARGPFEHSALTDVHSWSEVPAATPLFDSIVVFENYPTSGLAAVDGPSDLEVLGSGETEEQTNYPITVVIGAASELTITVHHDLARIDSGSAAGLIEHLTNLLRAMAAHPDRRLSELEVMSPLERRHVLVELNETAAEYPADRCVHELFEDRVREDSDAVAVAFGDEQLTYSELDAAANRLARHLMDKGVGPEVPVGICLERGPDLVVALLAVLKAGGVYLPLDPDYPAERLSFMLEDAAAAIVVSASAPAPDVERDGVELVLVDEDRDAISAYPGTSPGRVASPDNLAYVIYTSGSTGTPKGVAVGHRGMCNLARAQIDTFGVRRGEGVLQFSSVGFDASVWEVLMALSAGARLCIRPQRDSFSGEAVVAQVDAQDVNVATLTPTALASLPEAELPGLHTIVSAGESCPGELAARWSKGRRFFNAYGPTETTVCASLFRYGETSHSGAVPIGRPIANTTVYVLDRYGNPVPTGVAGELYVGGAGLARCYVNRPALTAGSFLPDPFSGSPGARIYRTGDRARYLHDGNVEFLGRIDHQVKVRGFRIEPGEIEASLMAHESVRDAVVVARADAGAGDRLVAYVVCEGAAPTTTELRARLSGLPDYMVPAHFVVLDELPSTPNGKLDRAALPAPDARRGVETVFVPPRTPAEQILAEVWSDALEVDRVGIHDDFFELGGHSLTAARVVSHANKRGLGLAIRDVFEQPTLVALARLAETGSVDEYDWESPIAFNDGGDREAVLLVNPVTVTTPYSYADLARALGERHPSFALQPLAGDGPAERLVTIEEMAEKCVGDLTDLRPEGPYVVGGWSLGAVVAWEVAGRLLSVGRTPKALVLIDPPDPVAREDEASMPDVDGWGREVLSVLRDGNGSTIDDRRRELLAPLFEEGGLPEQYLDLQTTDLIRFVEGHRVSAWAHEHYDLPSYEGDVILVVSTASSGAVAERVDVWRSVVNGDLVAYATDASHDDVLLDRHAGALASAIGSYLRRGSESLDVSPLLRPVGGSSDGARRR
nr:condensation domain-containing protein [uncultured bacterium]